MPIYRGPGGSGDAVNDASSEATLVAQLVVEAQVDADAAQASATAAAGSASTASTQATNASNSATAAAASAVTAANYVVPSQTGNNGKYLKTDGTATSWDALDISTADITGTLPLANGGTGGTTAATARTSLGLAIGTDVQAWDADLDTWATKTAPTGTVVGTSDTQTLTNKTIALGSNTVSGTLAQFNTAVTDADLVSIAGTETLTNKTLTSPTLTTPALGTPASGVVTNLTGTASININGTVGATTANTGAFTTLGATGVATFSAGTVSAPAITTTGDTNTGIFFPAADTIAFTEGGTESMRIDSSGNVGIGTSSPAQKLDVNGNANFGNISTGNGISTGAATIELGGLRTGDGVSFIDFHSASGTDYESRIIRVGGANGALQILNAGTGDFRLQASGAAPMIFDTSATERMRIDSSGNLLVGTTSSTTVNTGISVIKDPGEILIGHPTGTVSTWGYLGFRYANTTIGSVTQSGTTAVLYNTTSDYRLKENAKPIQNALATVEALNPVSFTWIDGRPDDGFLAHEIQAVIPNCVTGEKDAVDADGKPKYQQMDSSGVIPFLVKAIQEQQALIENLTTRLNALEGK